MRSEASPSSFDAVPKPGFLATFPAQGGAVREVPGSGGFDDRGPSSATPHGMALNRLRANGRQYLEQTVNPAVGPRKSREAGPFGGQMGAGHDRRNQAQHGPRQQRFGSAPSNQPSRGYPASNDRGYPASNDRGYPASNDAATGFQARSHHVAHIAQATQAAQMQVQTARAAAARMAYAASLQSQERQFGGLPERQFGGGRLAEPRYPERYPDRYLDRYPDRCPDVYADVYPERYHAFAEAERYQHFEAERYIEPYPEDYMGAHHREMYRLEGASGMPWQVGGVGAVEEASARLPLGVLARGDDLAASAPELPELPGAPQQVPLTGPLTIPLPGRPKLQMPIPGRRNSNGSSVRFSEEDEQEDAEGDEDGQNPENFRCVVKNTFISISSTDTESNSPTKRRAKSLPKDMGSPRRGAQQSRFAEVVFEGEDDGEEPQEPLEVPSLNAILHAQGANPFFQTPSGVDALSLASNSTGVGGSSGHGDSHSTGVGSGGQG